MNPQWISCTDRLPSDGQRVLCFIPKNKVLLLGGAGTEEREVILLCFAADWFVKNPSKTGRATHSHFWLGEGSSNRFFEQVTHWMPLPTAP